MAFKPLALKLIQLDFKFAFMLFTIKITLMVQIFINEFLNNFILILILESFCLLSLSLMLHIKINIKLLQCQFSVYAISISLFTRSF